MFRCSITLRKEEAFKQHLHRLNPPYDAFQSLMPCGRRSSSSFPSYPKLLSARWNSAHSLSRKLASSEAVGRTCGACTDPGAMSPEKSCSLSEKSSLGFVDEESKRAWNLLFNRMRHGSTSEDDASCIRRSAISNYGSQQPSLLFGSWVVTYLSETLQPELLSTFLKSRCCR
jgi:hypothetical protein